MTLEIFFNDKNKFGLGICNGCQMLSQLHSIIPGTDHWPLFNKISLINLKLDFLELR